MKRVDLNSDMGEGFGPWTIGDGVDSDIMPMISSANIATGFHAGDPSTMATTLRLAKQHNVSVGAHPGFRDLVGFGRRHIHSSPEELVNDVIYQVGALRELAKMYDLSLQHVKPHGALYMYISNDETLATLFVDKLKQVSPDTYLYAMSGSKVHHLARDAGIKVIGEFYADRDYDNSGSIVFTRKVGRMDPDAIAQKVLKACTEGTVMTVEGMDIPIDFESVCIHSDTPGALDLVKATYAKLREAGITITSPSAQ
jgi:UPF0271 protein